MSARLMDQAVVNNHGPFIWRIADPAEAARTGDAR